jgi:hypothetical protein
MGDTVLTRINKQLVTVFGQIGRATAEEIKRAYNLKELIIPNTLSSEILAKTHLGKNHFNVRVRKTGLNTGVLEIVNP